MSEVEKRSFFDSLNPKSALLVGIVAGILVLGTIGFIVLGAVLLKGDKENTNTSNVVLDNTLINNTDNTDDVVVNVTKSDKPKVELFIMSYCPYGLQMQKAYLPVMELLSKKADMDIKWVNYIMHDKKEIDENDRQYCIQKEQNDKYVAYAKCFTASANGDYSSCLKTAKIDENKMNACVKTTDKQFKTSEKYKDKSTWLSGYYPLYLIYDSLNTKYKVQGSPTLVINGTQVQANRTPEAVKKAICSAFKNAPSECSQTLSSSAAVAGFGAGTGADTVGADCGS